MTSITPNRTLLNIYQPNRLRLDGLQFPLTMTLTRWINEAITEKLDKVSPETAGVSPMVVPPVSIPAKFDPMAERRRLLRLQQGPKFTGPYLRKYPKGCDTYNLAESKDKKLGSGSPGMEAIIEDLCIGSNMEMTTEEKGAVLVAHAKAERKLAERAEKERQAQEREIEELKQAAVMEDVPQVNPHAAAEAKFEAVQKANRERMLARAAEVLGESPLVNVAAPAMEDVPTAKMAEDEEDEFWGSYDKIKANVRKHCQ